MAQTQTTPPPSVGQTQRGFLGGGEGSREVGQVTRVYRRGVGLAFSPIRDFVHLVRHLLKVSYSDATNCRG